MRLYVPMNSIEQSIKIMDLPDLMQSRNESKKVFESILKTKKALYGKPSRKIKHNVFWNSGDPHIKELVQYFYGCCTEINRRTEEKRQKNNISIRYLEKSAENLFIKEKRNFKIDKRIAKNDRIKLYNHNPEYYKQFWNAKGKIRIKLATINYINKAKKVFRIWKPQK